ncbi:MAG: hypothetical protein K2W95_05495, partial [Candidatus Obscuribacterales bacterium]|nr:hypothetical protein [Candidatus Obscuribacterales bacterium]
APHNEATTSTSGIEFLKHLFQSLRLFVNTYFLLSAEQREMRLSSEAPQDGFRVQKEKSVPKHRPLSVQT